MRYQHDERVVLTLDAGGTNFVFSAIAANREVIEPVRLPAETQVLSRSLETIESGFRQVMDALDSPPVAISFAFPGPADYPNGIIDNVGNLPAFAGGVALGPYLEERFGLPTFINNDGDLFAYGEAIAGLLPQVNELLADAGSPKRYQTLFAITLGTGLGGGLVHRGELFIGDNSNASEIWLLRNKLRTESFAEEGACIRSVRRSYAEAAGIPLEDSPSPQEIESIARGVSAGNQKAATCAFAKLGEVVGDALANAITLLDGLIVIGGGISAAHGVFMQPLIDEMQSTIATYDGTPMRRIVQQVFNLESPEQSRAFVAGATKTILVPGTTREISYDPMKRIGIGTTVLGTSKAVGIGAYAFALHHIDS
ncbi:ROK family protein [Allorhodopirellula heiligendammensis]|uniref:N-acetyl-D-glucosamine kinase n=1 Tax=Allorhodopirellula heiligendammensis TaxID=2714739 RepID=A0A5C6C315_9BACT|nr:ROK family protein [Allorhodopirellula heiligendammensis]TWU18518.1 N-acetyl-D-glucosamine kinase [Allorhodopirellula heiligendammensis]